MNQSRADMRTMCALAAMAFVAACFAHEVLGHGASCVATGGTVTWLTSVYFRCSAGLPIVDASGPSMNLAVAFGAAMMLRRIQGLTARTFLALLAAFNGFWGAGYFLFSGIADAGDWAFVLRDLSLEPRWLWRVAMVAAGVWLYGATLRCIEPALPRGRPLVAAYLAAGVVGCGSVLFYPGAKAPALLEAAKESVLAPLGLLYIAFARGRSLSSAPSDLPRSARLQGLALGVVALFWLTQGRGYRLPSPPSSGQHQELGPDPPRRQDLFAAIARNVAADPGVRPEDVLVSLVEVATENWSLE